MASLDIQHGDLHINSDFEDSELAEMVEHIKRQFGLESGIWLTLPSTSQEVWVSSAANVTLTWDVPPNPSESLAPVLRLAEEP